MFTLLLSLLAAPPAPAANSFPVVGLKADALVDSLVDVGLDPVGTHEYFQAGVTACVRIADDKGTYFPSGHVGDYVGESCLLYGDADGSDSDGVLRTHAIIPADDRNLEKNPALRQKLEKLRTIRLALEALVIPLTEKREHNGREVIITQKAGVAGIACDGRNRQGHRLCWVKPSSLCPPRQ